MLLNKEQKNLGGQERRWLRVASSLVNDDSVCCKVILNQATYRLCSFSDAECPERPIIITDNKYPLLDYLAKNYLLFVNSFCFDKVHISNQSASYIPAIFLIKYLLRKSVSFSYNGTSLLIHKNNSFFSYYNKVRFIHRITDKTEILNPILLDELWLNQSKTSIAPCSFSDSLLYTPCSKRKKLIFSGHFYEDKGIHLLKRLIESSDEQGFEIEVYGDSIPGDQLSFNFKAWLQRACEYKQHLKYRHTHNMAGTYSEATVFLSLQSISNYPSQSVIEALYSGCSVLMTNTGDSYLFGDYDFIRYIDDTSNIQEVWKAIHCLHQVSSVHYDEISSQSVTAYSLSKYLNFIKEFLK